MLTTWTSESPSPRLPAAHAVSQHRVQAAKERWQLRTGCSSVAANLARPSVIAVTDTDTQFCPARISPSQRLEMAEGAARELVSADTGALGPIFSDDTAASAASLWHQTEEQARVAHLSRHAHMSAPSTRPAGTTDAFDDTENDSETAAGGSDAAESKCETDIEKAAAAPAAPTSRDEEYPEGGLRAYLVVAGVRPVPLSALAASAEVRTGTTQVSSVLFCCL